MVHPSFAELPGGLRCREAPFCSAADHPLAASRISPQRATPCRRSGIYSGFISRSAGDIVLGNPSLQPSGCLFSWGSNNMSRIVSVRLIRELLAISCAQLVIDWMIKPWCIRMGQDALSQFVNHNGFQTFWSYVILGYLVTFLGRLQRKYAWGWTLPLGKRYGSLISFDL